MTTANKSTLEIIIENAEFAKEFNYFIIVQLEGNGEKRRTAVSKPSKNPTFPDNKFYLPLQDYDLLIHQKITLSAYVVVDSSDNVTKDGKGQAKLLGENVIELAPLTPHLTNINDAPIRQKLDLYRKKGDSNVVVGRVNVTLKLLAETLIPDDELNRVPNDETHLLPEMDLTKSFVWRLRIDVRSAVNLPFNRTTESKLPSAYVEIGWTMYAHQDINLAEAVRTSSVDANRFPVWNQQLLFYPSSNVTTIDGFVTILLKDRFQLIPLQKCTFPIGSLKPFHPIHLDLLLDTEDNENRSHLYISLTLEDTPVYKLAESYVNVIVNAINFDPLPTCTNRCSVMMTLDKFKPEEIPYKQVELKSEGHISTVLFQHKSDPYTVFISNTIKIPPSYLKNQYGAIANFILPRSMLDKNLRFFLLVRDPKVISNHTMPNAIAGFIDVVDEMLKSSFYSKSHDIVPYKTTWTMDSIIYSAISHSRCVVEMSVRPVEESLEVKSKDIDDFDHEKIKQNMIKNAMENYTVNLSKIPEKEKWDILSKELAQKQELIHRMMKEVDDKTESLKMTGAEIVELRKQIKLLQNENSILRKRLGQEEQMQIESLVTQEIHKMSLPELKSKIIKLAQSYRAERMRNEEYEKALKQAQNEITNARKLAHELEQLQQIHEDDTKKFLNLQKETQKIGLYRETIKIQEQNIVKMESILKKLQQDSDRQKESLLELERLRTENLQLQKELKDFVINSTPGVLGKSNPEVEKYKKEVTRLEKVVSELQEDLRSKRPISAEKRNIQNEVLELEVKYHKALSRVRSLEQELDETTKKNAKEISALRMLLSEKQALIDNIQMDRGYN